MRVETNSHTYTIMNSIFSQFDVAEFPKTPSPKPARIPPQTPPAGGKSAEAGRIRNPRQIVSPCRVLFSSFNHLDFARKTFELCPTNTAIKNSRVNCGFFMSDRRDSHQAKVLFFVELS